MKTNLHILFRHLVSIQDPELLNLVREYTETSKSNSSSQGLVLHGLRSFETMDSIKQIKSDQAKTVLETCLKILEGCEGNESEALARIMKTGLGHEGLLKLLMHVVKRAKDEDPNFYGTLLGAPQIAESICEKVPACKVIVKRNDNMSKKEGDFVVKIQRGGETQIVSFPNKSAKAIYIWFLLHSRIKFSSQDIRRDCICIKNIIEICYSGSDVITTLEHHLEEDGDFSKFLTRAKADANKAIKAAIGNLDNPDWYLIMPVGTDSHNSKNMYWLELPNEDINIQEDFWKIATYYKYSNKM